jgi:transposase
MTPKDNLEVSGQKGAKEPELPTIWRVDDTLWEIILPILLSFHPLKKTGRPRANWRNILDGLIYHARTGCQWAKIPKEFGDDSTIHRWFQSWAKSGALLSIWSELIGRCHDLGGVEWEWQSADGSMVKAVFVKKNSIPPSAPIPRIEQNQAPR